MYLFQTLESAVKISDIIGYLYQTLESAAKKFRNNLSTGYEAAFLLMQLCMSRIDDCKALFRCTQNFKILQDFSSHRIFERMHEVLNIAKQNN